MKKIMFVCTGNICRSPMAKEYMQKKVKELGLLNEFYINSCGTSAVTGEKATKNANEAMVDYDVDLSLFEAKNVLDTDIKDYDLIFCLTKKHKQLILNMYKNLEGKVYTLKEYADDSISYIDIDDPWGLSLEVYKQCAKEIVENIDKIINKI
jgi:protein-tyrosine-phosphatase